ncbi:MAG: M36 family metallopeptidase [Bacteroidia bacterium]|nr:M36 family metallopeptidase [Bacteroidia bacterium]
MSDLNLTDSDIEGLIITNEYSSKHNGITHVYLNQTYKGIPISGAVINVNIDKHGRILNLGNRFVTDIKNRISADQPSLSRRTAAQFAYQESLKPGSQSPAISNSDERPYQAQEMYFLDNNGQKIPMKKRGISAEKEAVLLDAEKGVEEMIVDENISNQPFPVKLVYHLTENGKLKLAYELMFESKDQQHYWLIQVDASNGESLVKRDLITHDHWEAPSRTAEHKENVETPVSFYDHSPRPMIFAPPPHPNKYKVYQVPVESPIHATNPYPLDGRKLEVNPADPVASPFGWHDIDGATGAEYTTTQGNNVHAYEDRAGINAPGYSPDGGSKLDFRFPLDPAAQVDPAVYEDASITNLFYWNNVSHDIFYKYGFDEAAGNFQVNNYGNGGIGGDDVRAEGQDGGGFNNANFFTPPDGSRPRMQMFNWTGPAPDDLFTVNDPKAIAGNYPAKLASFGPAPSAGVSGDLVLVDDGVAPTTDACSPLGQIYSENFNLLSFPNLPPSLGNIDVDGNNANLGLQGLWAPPGTPWLGAFLSGDPISASTSWFDTPGQADDWMITPAINLGGNNQLSWRAISLDQNFSDDYEVRISTTGNTIADFMANPPLLTVNGENPFFTNRSLDLSALGFNNQTVYVAFRNISVDKYILVIDDVSVFDVPDYSNKIVLIDRGGCGFSTKVLNAQATGAEAVIVVNNIPGAEPFSMGGFGFGINIPSIMVSYETGLELKNAMQNGTVNVRIQGDRVFLDGDLDNGIIVHEYGHGVSIRLTGGALNTFCLFNAEQMGEGWSDYLGLVLTMQNNDAGEDHRGIGTFALGQTPEGNGIRPFPYSTDFNINPSTYGGVADFSTYSQPHGIGSIWAQMLWDMTWAFVDVYGFDKDFYDGNGGNNIALQLVMDGMKLQACNPGFVDGRDAILLADQINNNGANQCLIWKAFADRGLGYSASQGSSFDRLDGVEAFDMPPGCESNMQFVLVDAKTNQDIGILSDGDVLDMNALGTANFNIRAESIGNAAIGSVLMVGAGENHATNSTPFTLGAYAGGNYASVDDLGPGKHIVRAYPYSGNNKSGSAMGPSSVAFEIINSVPKINSLTLFNASNNQAIGQLNDGDVIDLASIGTDKISIVANVAEFDQVASFHFNLNEGFYEHTENDPIYAIAGNTGTNLEALVLEPGAYSLSVTAYEKINRGGAMGNPVKLNFTVINTSERAGSFAETEVKLHPNPTNKQLIVDLVSSSNEMLDIHILDATGKLVRIQKIEVNKGPQSLRLNMDKLPDGIYFLKFSLGEVVHAKKFVKSSE